MSPTPPLYKWQMMCFACLFSEDFKPRWPNVTAYCRKKTVNFSHKITCQQQKDSSTSALTTVQLDSFNTSIFFPFFIVEEIISQSQIKVNTAVRRAFLLYYKEKKPLCGQKIQDWSFFFFLFLWNAAVQTARVNCLSSLKSHHIHLGMDVLGCWKSGPLVHRATK